MNFCNAFCVPCQLLISTVCLRFKGHFPGGLGLAGTKMSSFWILLELRVMEAVVTTGAVRRAKLVKISPPTSQHSVFCTGRMPFLSPNQQCQRLKALTGNYTRTTLFDRKCGLGPYFFLRHFLLLAMSLCG